MKGIKGHRRNDNLISSIRKGDRGALDQFYLNHKEKFIGWAEKRFGITGADGTDIYQNAVIAFYENAVAGKINSEPADPGTYLFAIAKNMIRKYHRDKINSEELLSEERFTLDWDEPENDEKERITAVEKAMGEMKDGCRSLLSMYYYQNKSLDEIATTLGHKDKQVTKTQKSRCLKYLKDRVRNFNPMAT